jgi:hypothetical protein
MSKLIVEFETENLEELISYLEDIFNKTGDTLQIIKRIEGCGKKERFAGDMFEATCGKTPMHYGTFYCKECKQC